MTSRFTRMEIHTHSGMLGHARMMQMQARAIAKAKTATYEAKAIAIRIEHQAIELAKALKQRAE